MQTYIVGVAGAYRQGKRYHTGEKIRIPDSELPAVSWFHENGAPVRFKEEKQQDGSVKRILLPAGDPSRIDQKSDAEVIAEKEAEAAKLLADIDARKKALKAKTGGMSSLAEKQAAVDDGKKPQRAADK